MLLEQRGQYPHMLMLVVLVPGIERRMMVHDNFPARVGAREVVFDVVVPSRVGRIDVHVGIETEKVGVSVIE